MPHVRRMPLPRPPRRVAFHPDYLSPPHMKQLHFSLPYKTHANERLELYYSIDGAVPERVVMTSVDTASWQCTVGVSDDAKHLRHLYLVSDTEGRILRVETDTWRYFLFNHRSEVCFLDSWSEHPLPALYHHSAFRDCLLLPRGGDSLHTGVLSAPCLLLLHALPPSAGYRWAVVGNLPSWGEWHPERARLLQRTAGCEWALPLERNELEEGLSYKYILVPEQGHDCSPIWEEGDNRVIAPRGDLPASASVIRTDCLSRISLTPLHASGCVIPVFSLRSEGSWGTGDFGDLATLIRWSAETGLHALQLLPINDTTRSLTWHDSYPYSCISVFALHPLYLNPREWPKSKAFKQHEAEARRLNALPALDYEGVIRLKLVFLEQLFEEIGPRVTRSADFRAYTTAQASWLEAYATYCVRRDRYHTANFRHWPEAAQHTAPLPDDDPQRLQFYRFTQFLLHRQMNAAHRLARELDIVLKGDIPIGISPDSVPAWADSHLFHFDGTAGAPPDFFSEDGQNWGFPTYNWEAMAAEGYAWWQRRMDHIGLYFDAYRIDHVLGFFRIWEIPTSQCSGMLGHFRPALPFTAGEIHDYGFGLHPADFVRPRLSAAYVEEIALKVGMSGETFAARFLRDYGGDYTLRAPYDTQQSVWRELQKQEGQAGILTHETATLLCRLLTEVLFLTDPEQPDLYHPRIGAAATRLWSTLSPADREAFCRLHDDFFYRRHNAFWAERAMQKLPAITRATDALAPSSPTLYPLESTGPLPCAEDLGMVPDSVKGVLERLQILTLEIELCPKQSGVRFAPLASFPYLSVVTIGTHDMPPLRCWWKQQPDDAKAYWTDVLHHSPSSFPADPSAADCERIVAHTLQAPSMLRLLALQDLLAISDDVRASHPEAEQINCPANSHHYWQYRMHLTLEKLMSAHQFNEKLRALLLR